MEAITTFADSSVCPCSSMHEYASLYGPVFTLETDCTQPRRVIQPSHPWLLNINQAMISKSSARSGSLQGWPFLTHESVKLLMISPISRFRFWSKSYRPKWSILLKKIGRKGSDDRFEFFNLYYFLTWTAEWELWNFVFLFRKIFVLENIIKFSFNLNVKDIYFNLYVSFKIFKIKKKILPIFRIIMF